MAGAVGFEPTRIGLEPIMLPLHHTPLLWRKVKDLNLRNKLMFIVLAGLHLKPLGQLSIYFLTLYIYYIIYFLICQVFF